MSFTLYTTGRVESFELLRNGGIVFAIVERPVEKFFLVDDAMREELVARYIPTIDGECPSLQSINEAKEILTKVINEKAYVIIYVNELFGISVYRLEYSPVPGYAMMAYKDPNRTEDERCEILRFTKFVSENPDFYEVAYGKYVAIKNAEVVRELFRAPSDIKDFTTDDRIFCFCIGVMGTGQTTRFFRVANSARNCGNIPVSFEDAHYVPVTILQAGRIISPTKLYMVDSGADETSFPGYYDSDSKKFFTVENNHVNFRFVDVVSSSTANGNKESWRVLDEISVQVGNLEPIQLNSLCVDKTKPVEQNDKRKNYKNSLILGRDVLFKLNGCWFPGCDGKTQLSLENAPLRTTEENSANQIYSEWTNNIGKQTAKVGNSFLGLFSPLSTKK